MRHYFDTWISRQSPDLNPIENWDLLQWSASPVISTRSWRKMQLDRNKSCDITEACGNDATANVFQNQT